MTFILNVNGMLKNNYKMTLLRVQYIKQSPRRVIII